ncbi:hypothetical protein BH20ACT15_BH20ACT15_11310 [soil metagenome]
MGAPALALCSSLLYGLSDFLGGIKSRALPLLVVLVISQSAGLAPPSGSRSGSIPSHALDRRGQALGVATCLAGVVAIVL